MHFVGRQNTVERYDPTANEWYTVASMGTQRSCAGCAVYNGYLYVVGGRNEQQTTLSSVERYDPMTNVWMNDVAAMNNCRWGVRLYSHIDNYFSTTSKIRLESRLLFGLWLNGPQNNSINNTRLFSDSTNIYSMYSTI